jgi:DNA polymerase
MLVGEAPWKEEFRERAYFVGKAGSLLNIALAEAGLARKGCYVTNAVKCVTLAPSVEAVEFCKQAHLLEEIKIVEPNVVVAIGGIALKALGGHSRITKWRGHLLEVQA